MRTGRHLSLTAGCRMMPTARARIRHSTRFRHRPTGERDAQLKHQRLSAGYS